MACRGGRVFVGTMLLLVALVSAPSTAHALRYAVRTAAYTWDAVPTELRDLAGEDDDSAVVQLPFSFPFFDERFRALRIHTNGFVQLVTDDNSPTPADEVCGRCAGARDLSGAGSPDAPGYIVAAWWADWTLAAGGSVRHGPAPSDPRHAYVVTWHHVSPYAFIGKYTFQMVLHSDGRIDLRYRRAIVGSVNDGARIGSIGAQPRRGAQHGRGVQFAGQPYLLGDGSALALVPQQPSERPWPSANADIPAIVQRHAPELYVDWAPYKTDAGVESRCNSAITTVDFDGDLDGENSLRNLLLARFNGRSYEHVYRTPANVYYSYVETATHHIIGYYIYQPYDCTSPDWYCANEHEHDFGGVHIAVNKTTGKVDAVLGNAHGNRVPYVALRGGVQLKMASPHPEISRYFTMVTRHAPFEHQRLAVGVEADTHVVWGRYDDKCIIGDNGSPHDGCRHHGGDGFILTYDWRGDGAEEPPPSGYPQYPRWPRYRYTLRSIDELFRMAQTRAHCGPGQLFACNAYKPTFSHEFKGKECNKGNLPWSWGTRDSSMSHTCEVDENGQRKPNLLSDPARVFDAWFRWPRRGYFDVPQRPSDYLENPYTAIEKKCSLLPLIARLPAE